MNKENRVLEVLGDVMLPQSDRSLKDLNLIRNVEVTNGHVKVTLASTALNPSTRDWVESSVHTALAGFPEFEHAELAFTEVLPKDLNKIDYRVAVMSGKGGVGKSLITGLLAVYLRRKGKKVGILDADITGPSIPRMFGIDGHPAGSESGILPVPAKTGIEIMSINLLLSNQDDAVIWRGPLIARAIQQFWEEVLWGNLDYLLVDLPPGTADAPLTVMQSIPLSGVVVALTPQDLTAMVVRKAVRMAGQMNVPILGVVENMSYFLVPDSGKRIDIFGMSRGMEMARTANAPLMAQLPLDPELARLCDAGTIETYDAQALDDLGKGFVEAMKVLGATD